MTAPITLAPDESPPGHPWAEISAYPSDLSLLAYLLQDLRALMRRARQGHIQLSAYESRKWKVHGLMRRTVICKPEELLDAMDVQIVGFFGNRRGKLDDVELNISEHDLLDEFRSYPGILSYSSIELVDDQWANLVVHTNPDDREEWRNSQVHIHAVEHVAPKAYHAVRIHNGHLKGGPIGCESIVIERTKYWDYDVSPTWHAIRELPHGASQHVATESAALDDIGEPINPTPESTP